MKTYFYYALIVIFFPLTNYAQSGIAIGEWKSYLPYQKAINLTQSTEKIYFNTGTSLISIDKKDNDNVTFMSTVEGLTEASIKLINYDKFNDQLLVIYNNSKFDIIKDGKIFSIVTIAQNTNIPGDKTIYSVHIANKDFAYLGTGFGFVQFNLQTFEFGYTCETSLKVSDIDHIGEDLYIATSDGLYHYNNTISNNPADFNQWLLFDDNVGLPTVYNNQRIAVFDNHLYAQIDEDLWKYVPENAAFQKLINHESDDQRIVQLYPTENELLVGSKSSQYNSQVEYLQKDGSLLKGNNNCSNLMTDILMDEKGGIWYCDEWREIRYMSDKNANCNFVHYNSPIILSASDIDIKDNIVYIANGGVSDEYGSLGTWDGYSILKNANWENQYRDNLKDIKDKGFANLFRLLKHPKENKMILGSYYNGIMIHNLDDNSTIVYNKENSSLQGAIGDNQRTRVSGLAFDDNDNLWISNYTAQSPISVLTKDGKWRSFELGNKYRTTRLAIDDYGNKWIALFGGGIAVLKTDEDIINGKAEYKLLSTSNSALTSNLVNDIIKDADGAIWAGTDKGPVIFNCGDIFASECTGYRQKVVEDGDVAFLLATENILCIEVDGANRKWFGTTNGIFVQSADGEEKVVHYDINNSPLFSNTVKDIAFNKDVGEMFIVTANGLQSFRTKTTGGTNKHQSEVYAFPNPVRPDFYGEVAIRGLAQDADVKITDVTGKLVYETQALGGQALWDLKDYNGVKAATGVYLVFSASTKDFDKVDSFVTKILVVK